MLQAWQCINLCFNQRRKELVVITEWDPRGVVCPEGGVTHHDLSPSLKVSMKTLKRFARSDS